MTVTFSDARAAVQRLRKADWAGTAGELFVSPEGLEDAADFCVSWGAREFLVDDDSDFMLLNNVVTFVSKATGEPRDEPVTAHLEKLGRMTPVS